MGTHDEFLLLQIRRTAVLAQFVVVLFCGAQAKSADLGGDCCADLEQRVSELEATTVRKALAISLRELTPKDAKAMSAFNPKADFREREWNVRYVPEADMIRSKERKRSYAGETRGATIAPRISQHR